VRLTYRKVERARFISHLELVGVFTHAFRRAGIPIAYSRGHHPMPRFRFSPGLPLGVESDCETLDADLTESWAPARVGAALAGQLPEGLAIVSTEAISLKAPSTETELAGFRYHVDLRGLVDGEGGAFIDQRLGDFERAAEFVVRKHSPRGDKDVDAKRLVERLARVAPDRIELDLRFTPAGSIKPSELLAAVLGLDAATARALPLRKTHAFTRVAPAAVPLNP
jgi:radical SAM-linked protein